MAWVKIDDAFPDHWKLAELGAYAPLCGWLYVCGLCYCNRQLTDGLIPKDHIRRLAGFDRLSIETGVIGEIATFGDSVDVQEVAALLVQSGLWEDPGGRHYLVHDYLVYQPSREAVLRERAQTAERKERWRERRSERRGNAVPNAGGTPAPDPDPVKINTHTPRARVTNSGALAGSLPRDHMDHAWCGARFCVTAKTFGDMARRYGAEGEAAVTTWLRTFHDGLGPDQSVGGPLWVLQHFDAHLSKIGRVTAPVAATTKPLSAVERFRASQAAKGGVA